MKLLFVFCCLSAGCFIWTEANPFFFNLQKIFPQRNIQIQRQPVAVTQGTNFGFGGIISKWFPSIIINKQYGTRRPKATQRPVIEVTTNFVPSVELEKEDASTSTTQAPAETIDSFNESSSSSNENPVDEVEVEENSSTTPTTTTTTTTKTTTTTTTSKTTTENSIEDLFNFTEEETTSTTTAVPFEEIEPFTESKTSTTTTELPFEETEPLTEINSSETTTETTTTAAPAPLTDSEVFNGNNKDSTTAAFESFTDSTTTSTTTTELPIEESNLLTTSKIPSKITTDVYGSFAVGETSTTSTEVPFEGSETTTTTSDAESLINSIGFSTEGSTSSISTEVSQPSKEYLPSATGQGGIAAIKPTTYRPAYVPTKTTTNAPWKETTTSNIGGIVDWNETQQPYRPANAPSTTTTNESWEETSTSNTGGIVDWNKPQQPYRPANAPSTTATNAPWEETASSISNTGGSVDYNKPQQPYRPAFVSTTTTANAPWKETPTNLINTGGYVDSSKPIESYVYVRPEISVDDILFNEVSPKRRPFETLSVIGTTSNGNQVERIYQPETNTAQRVTFYSNY